MNEIEKRVLASPVASVGCHGQRLEACVTIATVRRGLLACLGAAALTASSACGSSQANALNGKSPDSVLNAAINAAARFDGVHYVLQTTSDGHKQTVIGDATANTGAQSIVIGSDQTVVEVMGMKAYVRANAGGLEDTIGLSPAAAMQNAGKWIAFQPSDSPYQTLAQGVTLSSLLSQLRPTAPLAESTPGTVSGHQVVGVRGGLQNAPGAGQATFWIATAAPNALVGADAQVTTKDNKTVTEVGVFSKWGERFRVRAPSGAVPFASLEVK